MTLIRAFSYHPPVLKILFLIGALFSGNLAAASPEKAFLNAREAFAKGQSTRFEASASKVPADHLLAPYIAWWRLGNTQVEPDRLRAFIRDFPDTPLSNRALKRLIGSLYTQQQWASVLLETRHFSGPDREVECMVLHARVMQHDYTAIQEAKSRFTTTHAQIEPCEALYTHLHDQGQISEEEVASRLRLALSEGQTGLARRLDAWLPEGQRMEATALRESDLGATTLIETPTNARGQREAALHALHQKAKKDPAAAARLWETVGNQYSEIERRYGWGQIAVEAARRHDPMANTWFRRMGGAFSDLQHEWQTRSLLRSQRWTEVYAALQAMPPRLQDEPVWRYWKARALQAMNAHASAQQIFAPLSQEFNYYGRLAEEALPERLQSRPIALPLSDSELRFAEAHTGLKRALLLRKLGLDMDAVAEWTWALRDMNDRQLLAAAELARQARWYDRAISTAELTREAHSIDLRYITPYRDLAESFAHEENLDVAWVYGLMRQESRFIEYAHSRVGAGGLMQIMPKTARWIGQQMGVSRKTVKKVGQPETNIRFGTWYLKKLYNGLDQSAVLATAAYNAGPARARKWQANTALEGAIYVETIPFLETRQYVKKVLANAMFYAERLGGPQTSLKDRLGIIPPRSNVPLPEDELTPAIN